VAVSGIRFAVTRLVSEELGWAGARRARRHAEVHRLYGLFFGFASGAVMWCIAQPVGFLWIEDAAPCCP
jgi:Na+-driven multidrug efflux pump